MNLKVGFLCSGDLGFYCLSMINTHLIPQFIFTDKKSVDIINYARRNNIPIFIGNPRTEKTLTFLKEFETDIIFSINYLFIVNQDILKHPHRFAINFHGSILPKYRGRTPHVWAIINGEKRTGITAHIMEEEYDSGDIILQENVKIDSNNTGNDILMKYKVRYPRMIEKIINSIKNNEVTRVKQDNTKATYFGKRTPNDGHINWNWQKERIYNWVRAQAYPYPGAFTYFNRNKVIIDKIRFSDFGFKDKMQNGLIIETTPVPLIKTPNGVIELKEIRDFKNTKFKKNICLR